MLSLEDLQIVPFTDEDLSIPYPDGDLPWQVYQSVRNAVVSASREFGPTGPMGEVTIDWNVDDPYLNAIAPDFWPLGDSKPTYYVIDDQYNDDQYCYVELYGDNPFTPEWLTSIVEVMREHEGWAVSICNLPNCGLLIFGDRVMVNGPELAECTSAAEVLVAVKRLLDNKNANR